jgi:hypothetical protein
LHHRVDGRREANRQNDVFPPERVKPGSEKVSE